MALFMTKTIFHSGKTALFIFLFTLVSKTVVSLLLLNLFDLNIAEDFYDDIARNVVEGNGYVIHKGEAPNLWRAPLYPYFLALVYKLFGGNDLYVIPFQILFDSLTILVIYYLVKEIYDEKTGIITACAFTIYPFASYYTVHILSESMFTLLLTLVIYYLVKACRAESDKYLFFTGLLLGVLTLCRPSTQFFPLFIFIGLTLYYKNKAKAFRGFIILLTAFIITISPWVVRNYKVADRFVFLGTGGGYNLWLGNNLPTDGKDNDELAGKKLELLLNSISHINDGKGDQFEIENDKKFFKEAVRGFSENMADSFVLIIKKAFRFWFYIYHPDHRSYLFILIPLQAILLSLALFGVYISIKEHRDIFFPIAIIIYFNMLHAAIVSTFRYSIPIMPYVIMFAVYGVTKTGLFCKLKNSG